MYVLNSLPEFLLSDVSEEPAGHHPLPVPLLGELIVPELLEGVAELLPLQDGLLRERVRTVRVLRRWVDLVNQIRPVLVGRHIRLKPHILVLRTVEVPSEVHSRLCEKLLSVSVNLKQWLLLSCAL